MKARQYLSLHCLNVNYDASVCIITKLSQDTVGHILNCSFKMTPILQIKSLLDEARRFCEVETNHQAHLFLVRQLCRCYGTNTMEMLSQNAQLCWVKPRELRTAVRKCYYHFSTQALVLSCKCLFVYFSKTNTRHVCTHSNAFLMANPNIIMKFAKFNIFVNCLDLHIHLPF